MDKNNNTTKVVKEDIEVGMMILYRTSLYKQIKKALLNFEKKNVYVAKGYACITVPESKVEGIANAIHQIDKKIRISTHSLNWKKKQKEPTNNTNEAKVAAKKARKDKKKLKKFEKRINQRVPRKVKKRLRKQNKTLADVKKKRVNKQATEVKITPQKANKSLKKAA